MLDKLNQYLFKEVDNSGIILWRILLGFLLLAEAWGCILTGWLKETFVDPSYRFTFIGFEFLQILSGPIMYLYAFIMGLFGLMFMLGWKYRFAAIAYFIMWAGLYFGQKSNYNNHYYLLLLLLGIMIVIPANSYTSIDAKKNPNLKKVSVPNWAYFILKAQFAIVYFYAVVAKLYPDWLQALPLKIWLKGKADYWLIGPFLQQDWLPWFMSYAGIFYDATIIPFLLFKKTRYIALGLSLIFHLSNSAIFQIGVFPFMAISAIVIFWDPNDIRKLFFKKKPPFEATTNAYRNSFAKNSFVLIIGLYLIGQIYLPLRHYLYPGNVHWTEEGHRLSWHMMTRSKTGYGNIEIKDLRTGKSERIDVRNYLGKHQQYSFYKRPDMIWQFTQYLKSEYEKDGKDSIAIYVSTKISLNGRPKQPIVNPNFDFTTYPKWERFKHKEWITELED